MTPKETQGGEKVNQEPRIGEWVTVKPVEGHISAKKNAGQVSGVMGKYCRVEICYGRARGFWDGLVADVKCYEPLPVDVDEQRGDCSRKGGRHGDFKPGD